MLSAILVFGFLAFQSPSQAGLTPEVACGPEYHQFSPPPPSATHPPQVVSMKDLLSNDILVEGTVVSKRTYFEGGVQNDIKLRISKVLKGSGLNPGNVITVHIYGGFAPNPDDNVCYQDDTADGMRVEASKAYLVSLGKEAETKDYRSAPLGSWFRLAPNGDIIPLTPSLFRSHALIGKKAADIEAAAKEELQ